MHYPHLHGPGSIRVYRRVLLLPDHVYARISRLQTVDNVCSAQRKIQLLDSIYYDDTTRTQCPQYDLPARYSEVSFSNNSRAPIPTITLKLDCTKPLKGLHVLRTRVTPTNSNMQTSKGIFASIHRRRPARLLTLARSRGIWLTCNPHNLKFSGLYNYTY